MRITKILRKYLRNIKKLLKKKKGKKKERKEKPSSIRVLLQSTQNLPVGIGTLVMLDSDEMIAIFTQSYQFLVGSS